MPLTTAQLAAMDDALAKIILECESAAATESCYDCMMASGACESHGNILGWARQVHALLPAPQPDAAGGEGEG